MFDHRGILFGLCLLQALTFAATAHADEAALRRIKAIDVLAEAHAEAELLRSALKGKTLRYQQQITANYLQGLDGDRLLKDVQENIADPANYIFPDALYFQSREESAAISLQSLCKVDYWSWSMPSPPFHKVVSVYRAGPPDNPNAIITMRDEQYAEERYEAWPDGFYPPNGSLFTVAIEDGKCVNLGRSLTQGDAYKYQTAPVRPYHVEASLMLRTSQGPIFVVFGKIDDLGLLKNLMPHANFDGVPDFGVMLTPVIGAHSDAISVFIE